MAKPSPIVLSDSFLDKALRQAPVTDAFPRLAQSVQRPGKTCKCRGGGGGTSFTAVRAMIMAMPDADLNRLKALLNVPNRPFTAYVTSNGRHQKQTR